MIDDYYDKFLDLDEPESDESLSLPNWVSQKNNSHKSYIAIQDLRKDKQNFIRRNGLKSSYEKKSNYQIQKAEVARLVGCKPQPLFNSCSYSEALTRYLDDVNKELDASRERRITKKGGLRQKKKDDLVKALQESEANNERLLFDNVDAMVQRTINNIPLDIRRKLGIKS